MDLGDVGGPVDDPGVEAERLPVGLVQALVAGQQPVDAVDGLALGVGAVELDVGERPLGLVPALLQPGRPQRLAAAQRERVEGGLGPLEGVLGPLELALHPAPAREGPVGHHDGLALAVVQGVLEEPAAAQVDQGPVAQRVGRARRHLGDGRLVRGLARRRIDHGRHHQVDGDHVDGPLGDAGELLEQAAAVADDDGLGHAEAPDPARAGLGQGGLDDRRPHDRHRQVAPLLEQRPLAQGLGVGVGVGPAQRGGPGPADLHHPLPHPALAAGLGLGRQRRRAGRAQLAPGLLAEAGQRLGPAALGLGVAPGLAGALDLAAPVHVHEERAVVHRLLGRRAPAVAGHVAGRHRHQVGTHAQLVEREGHARGPEQVDLDRGVERRVERHRRGRVDHDVASRQRRPPRVVEPEAVGAHVAGDDRHPALHHLVEGGRAQLVAQAVEGVVAEDLAPRPLEHRRALPRAHQQHQLAAGHRAQQPLDQRGAQEAGPTGDGDAAAVECLGDHVHLSTIW